MAIPTVKDLIEELGEYGGHLPVKLLLDDNEENERAVPLVISDQTVDGEMTVVIVAE